MKRFYKTATIGEQKGGYRILLDGRGVKTPMKRDLVVSSRDLAYALAQEWADQGDVILPETMPLTQIASTCIDRVADQRREMTDLVMKYLDTDLLCYRLVHPPELTALQEQHRTPWIKWFEQRFETGLATTEGLDALRQPEDAHKRVRAYIENLGNEAFTILQMLTGASGSLVLSVAFTDGAADEGQVFNAIKVEETHKAALYDESFYGPDPAQDKKDKALWIDLTAAKKYLGYLERI